MRAKKQRGFTAVELLVTLFVAAAFLIAGYQLFSVVIRDGGQTRAEANASNVAYDYLRQYSTNATNPCAPTTPLNDEPITIDGLVSVSATIAITCPNSDTSGISKVKVTIRYNNPQQSVQYSTFVNGVSEPSAVMDGLAGWWRLNNNALDSIGAAHGTALNVTSATGQNNVSTNAFEFNGTSAYINIPHNTSLNVDATFTVTSWINPSVLSSRHGIFSTRTTNSAGAFQFEVGTGDGGSNRLAVTGDGVWIMQSPDNTVTTNAWQHVAYVRTNNSSAGDLYYNGSLITPSSTGAYSITNNTSAKRIGQGTSSTQHFQGRLDDVRIYNRALSGAEITTIYNEGAL